MICYERISDSSIQGIQGSHAWQSFLRGKGQGNLPALAASDGHARLLMMLRTIPPTGRRFFFAPWQVIALLAALLMLASCALDTPKGDTTNTPTANSSTSATYPYKPGPQAAQALRECKAAGAAPGGCF